MIDPYPHQESALGLMKDGCVLYGGTGSGKSLTSLMYYTRKHPDKQIVVITTAKKRDHMDWDKEALKCNISTDPELSQYGGMTVDSWNNIGKYADLEDHFFIFDEQRLVGYGAWVKSFLKIAKNNPWVLLSATPGDTWLDYAPLFIANGYYKNITEFKRAHVVYEPFVQFPKVRRYLEESKLQRLRNEILVEMPYEIPVKRSRNWLQTGYDQALWDRAVKDRWHVYEDRPIRDVGELFRVMRRIVNTDPSRMEQLKELLELHPRMIVFYNFNYELEILRTLYETHNVSEYNGHVKDPVPTGDSWVYLVQYQAGSEAWECTETDAMTLWSLTYSYKNHKQAQGRIARLNTPYEHLYYYFLASQAPIDAAIRRSLMAKKDFNEAEMAENL